MSWTWSSGSRGLAVRLLAVVVPPALMLVWLGVELLQQDRSLLAQHERERAAVALQAAVHAFDASLGAVERQLRDGTVPSGCVRITFRTGNVVAEPPTALAWLPAPPSMPTDDAERFASVEAIEFRGEPARALPRYRDMARAHDSAVRAGALLRAARVLRQQRRWNEASDTYGQLAQISTVAIAGAPADLQARRARCDVLADSHQVSLLSREAAQLEVDLVAGRWSLDRPAWERSVADIERWLGRRVAIRDERTLLSHAVDAVWAEHLRGAWPPIPTSGRRLFAVDGADVTVVWHAQGAETAALIVPPSALRAWTAEAIARQPAPGDRLGILGAN